MARSLHPKKDFAFFASNELPHRLADLTLIFGRIATEISMIFNHILNHILAKFGHLISSFDQQWLSKANLDQFCDAVVSKGSPLPKCWGFIDGKIRARLTLLRTVRAMCPPTRYQRECYNGHKRVHALKYQSVVAPNGLVVNLFGPIEGRRHDAYMLSESGLLDDLSTINEGEEQPYCLYGDPAYPVRVELQGPFKGSRLTAEQILFNKAMSGSRVSVEWVFGKVLALWAFVDFKKNQRLFLQPLSKYFKVAVILTYIHTCMYGSQTSSFFDVLPPSIENYLVKL